MLDTSRKKLGGTGDRGQYNTIQYNTIQYNTIQHNTTQYNTIQYNTPWQTDGETDGQTDRRIYIRYCSHCPQCKECDSHKPAHQFAGVFTRSKADRCLGCQYPSCTHCPGYRHPRAKKAVQISHKIGGKWFCRRSKACEQAAMSARKA
jgi:hypothetical protein